MKIRIYCFLIADILIKVLHKRSLSSSLPNIPFNPNLSIWLVAERQNLGENKKTNKQTKNKQKKTTKKKKKKKKTKTTTTKKKKKKKKKTPQKP